MSPTPVTHQPGAAGNTKADKLPWAGETQTNAAFPQAGAAPLLPASTIALVSEKGNLPAGGINEKEPCPPPKWTCHSQIPLPADLQGLRWKHLWARHAPAQGALDLCLLHSGSDITVPRDLSQLPKPPLSPEGTGTT